MLYISIDMKEEAGTVGGIFQYEVRCDSFAVDIETLIPDCFGTFLSFGFISTTFSPRSLFCRLPVYFVQQCFVGGLRAQEGVFVSLYNS